MARILKGYNLGETRAQTVHLPKGFTILLRGTGDLAFGKKGKEEWRAIENSGKNEGREKGCAKTLTNRR